MLKKFILSLTLSTILLSATEIKIENLNTVIDSQRTLLIEKLNNSNEKLININDKIIDPSKKDFVDFTIFNLFIDSCIERTYNIDYKKINSIDSFFENKKGFIHEKSLEQSRNNKLFIDYVERIKKEELFNTIEILDNPNFLIMEDGLYKVYKSFILSSKNKFGLNQKEFMTLEIYAKKEKDLEKYPHGYSYLQGKVIQHYIVKDPSEVLIIKIGI